MEEHRVCRACLSQQKNLISIDSMALPTKSIQNMLDDILHSTLLDPSIQLSDWICPNCLADLKIAYRFKTMLELSVSYPSIARVRSVYQAEDEMDNANELPDGDESASIDIKVEDTKFENDTKFNVETNAEMSKSENDDDENDSNSGSSTIRSGNHQISSTTLDGWIKTQNGTDTKTNVDDSIPNQYRYNKVTKTKRENKAYRCDICKRGFQDKGLLKTHIERHYVKRNQYKCLKCDCEFLVKTHFKKHKCHIKKE